MIDLKKDLIVEAQPFPHICLEDLFSDKNGLNDSFPTEDYFTNSLRMDRDMTYPMSNYIDLISREKSYNKLHNYVYSVEFVKLFLGVFKTKIEELVETGELRFNPLELPIISTPFESEFHMMNDNLEQKPFLFPRLDIGFGGANYGKSNGGAGIHTDNAGRLISMLYYVNTPKEMVGGEHRMWGIDNKVPILEKEVKAVSGRLLASLQTNYALHDVNPITKIKGYRKAFYLAISCNQPIWNASEDWLMKLTSNRDPQKHVKKNKQLVKLKNFVKKKMGK